MGNEEIGIFMKNLFLIVTISIALSTSALAGNKKNPFYIKLDVGGSWLQDFSLGEVYNREIKLKSKFAAMAIIGVGYYILDNFRTDLTFEKVFSPKFETNFIVEKENKVQITNTAETLSALMLNAYFDLFDVSIARFFIGGGAGISQQKHSVKVNVTIKDDFVLNRIKNTELKNGFAYQLTAGISAPLNEVITAEFAYSWRDYGKRSKTQSTGSSVPNLSAHNALMGFRFSF